MNQVYSKEIYVCMMIISKQQKENRKIKNRISFTTHSAHPIPSLFPKTNNLKMFQQSHSHQSFSHDQPIDSNRSQYRDVNFSSDNLQKDLELLIRAHQRIRQLEEQNNALKEQTNTLKNDQLKIQHQLHHQTMQLHNLQNQNTRLTHLNHQLLAQIQHFKNQLNHPQEPITSKRTPQHQTLPKNQFKHVQTEQEPLEQFTNDIQKDTFSQSQKTLNQSESTPLILNINLNPFTRQERQSFLASCKQQFAQQLSKIKEASPVRSKHHFSGSEYLTAPTSNKNSQIHFGKNHFIKEAEQEFMDENSKTMKNIYTVERKKSVSSTAGSLYKRSFGTKTYGNEEKTIFGDKTNIWNSKYALMEQTVGVSKSHHCRNSQSNLKILNPNGVSSQCNGFNNTKNKSIQFKPDNSRNVGFDRSLLNNSNYKSKDIQLELRNSQHGGLIKYRGLCL